MVCIFRGTGPADAWLVRDRLSAEGIPCQVRDHLSAGRGELPIPDSWPTVWVAPSYAEEARAFLHREETLRLVVTPWTCRTCGEVNEGRFEWCWKCQTASC
jgi:hypothetical protein